MVLLSQNVAVLDSLRAAQSFAAQTEALRALKNETVGHVMKKEKWVELGALRPIVKVLLPQRPANWSAGDSRGPRQDSHDASGSRWSLAETLPNDLPADDLARLQALELLGVFASGGPAFLAPLYAAGALPAVLAYIDPDTAHPRLVYAALRAVANLASAAQLVSAPVSSPSPVTIRTLADAVLAGPYLHAFYNIIIAPPHAWWTEAITNAAVALISPLCCETRHQVALANAGVLDALAVKVASYVVAQGQVVPGADLVAEKEGLRDAFPAPATPRLDIAAVLDAVAAILGDSRLRACMLLASPPILAIFPQIEFDSPVHDIYAAWKALSRGGLSTFDQQSLGALDFLLPAIPSQQSRSHLSHNSPFPPLGLGQSRENLPGLAREASSAKRGSGQQSFAWSTHGGGAGSGAWNPAAGGLALDGNDDEPESPMVPWLIHLVRSTSGMERLMAASVLTSIYKAGFASKTREAAMALLVVPLLLRMLDGAVKAAANAKAFGDNGSNSSQGFAGSGWNAPGDSAKTSQQQAITEAALIVLARLVANSDVLQKAAVDGNAVKILAKLLKESYEPVSVRSNPRPWNPTPTSSAAPTRAGTPVTAVRSTQSSIEADDLAGGGGDGGDLDSPSMLSRSSKLGPAGQNSLLAYRIRLREVTLKALTSLLAVKYEYQKAFVEQEAMAYVVESLSPTPSKLRGSKDKAKTLADAMLDGHDNCEDEFDPEYGRNPVGVLVAACNCVRMLSRSIAILRTTLEDAGVAAPIFWLLRHPDIDVQIAATGVVCNLVTETSPMRDAYAGAGLMNILCTLAHSPNPALRLNSLWALKHFVDGVEPSVKKACLERLGSRWVMQIIDPDFESDSPVTYFPRHDGYRSSAAATAAAAAATRSATAGMDEDVEMDRSDDDDDSDSANESLEELDEDDEDADVRGSKHGGRRGLRASTAHHTNAWAGGSGSSTGGNTHASPGRAESPSLQRARFPRTIHERSRTGRLRLAEAKIARLRELEYHAQAKNAKDDVAIQEQGLNFIRNLIGPGSCSPAAAASGAGAGASARDTDNEATEMIDYLFQEIGQERLFRVLLSRLKAKPRAPRFPARAAHQPAARTGTAAGGGGIGGGPASVSSFDMLPRLQPPPTKIVEAVVFILVHISASVPRHRQLVISQTEILQVLVMYFLNRDKGVRLALCHLVTNLTWRDDQADTQTAASRALELSRLGLLSQLEALQSEDAELDVRQQAKMAVHQLASQSAL